MTKPEMTAAEYRHAVLAQMSEKDFQQNVINEARELGWLVFHPYDSRRSEPGFPDLVLTHPEHGTIFMELKTEKGKLSKHQRHWLDTLLIAGERAYVIRPSDMDFVEDILRGDAAEYERLEATR